MLWDTARMDEVTVQELRDSADTVIDRVHAGERLTVTRSGRAVAELRPLPRRGPDPAALLDRWRKLPRIDPAAFRRDIDQLLDPRL